MSTYHIFMVVAKINKLFLTTVFLFLLSIYSLIFFPAVCAELSVAKANIKLEIVNQYPIIYDVSISAQNPSTDGILLCEVNFFDEHKKDAKINYVWRVDGNIVKQGEGVLGESLPIQDLVNVKDSKVDCIASVTDMHGLSSKVFPATTKVAAQKPNGIQRIISSVAAVI